MSIINNMPNVGGGMNINGIIKDYYVYAGENISTGDLVEFINGVAGKTDYGESVDTDLVSSKYAGYIISAVVLDENRVFIAHSVSTSYFLHGVVVTINNTEITLGIDTELSDTSYKGKGISAIALDENRVFIAHNQNDNTQYLFGMVVTIDGTIITVGTDTELNTAMSNTGITPSTCLLPNGNVFIAHDYSDSSHYLYGMVVKISNTEITKGTDTAIAASTNAGFIKSTCLLSNGNVFIAHSYGTNYYLYGIVVSIDGTTITKGSDTVISNSTNNTGYRISAVALDDSRVFIAYAHTDGSSYLYGIVCTISGTTITKGTETLIAHEIRAAYTIETIKLDDSRVFIAHSYTSSMYLYGIVCTISDMTITPGVDTCMNNSVIYATNTMKPLMLNNGTILLAHSYSTDYYLYAQIFGIDYDNNIPTNQITITEYETQVRKATTAQFDGVARTSGAGGDDTGHKDLVSIWTLFLEEPNSPETPEYVEVTKTDNMLIKNWDKVSNTEYVANDGTKLTVSVGSGVLTSSANTIDAICDGNDTTYSECFDGGPFAIILEFPNAQKISKMQYIFGATVAWSANEQYTSISGSNDNSTWVELFKDTSAYTGGGEKKTISAVLSNVDYYKFYKLYLSPTGNNLDVYEWQTSEYIVKELKGGAAV